MVSPLGIDVLIAADDSSLTDDLVRALRERDLSTDIAADGTEARRLLARQDYTVVVVDLGLPSSEPFDILAFMKAERLTSTNIVIVAAADGAGLVQLDRAGIKTVVLKPIDLAQLANYIRALTIAREMRLR